jgi:DMSO reductase anchor subunit
MSVLGVLAVICTAGISSSLKPIPAWNNRWVMPNYVALAAMSGMLLLTALASLFNYATAAMYFLSLALIALALAVKLGYWRFIDTMAVASTPETATGLGALGKVRLFKAPHTSENYLMKEMGFRVARKHARKLRMISIVFGFILPALLLAIAYAIGGIAAGALSVTAACISMVGLLTERWLFFAEAKHTVTLYYGGRLDG